MTESSKTSSEDSTDSKTVNVWEPLERKLMVANLIAIILLFFFSLLLVLGCSPSQQIAAAATSIGEKAASSKDRFSVIEFEATGPNPDLEIITEQAVGGRKEQQAILEMTGDIHRTMPGVEDQVPEWVYSLQYIAIALIAMVGAWVLWHTGLGTLVKRIISFVPKKNQQ